MFKKIIFFVAALLVLSPAFTSALSMGERLQGKLLLQVEQGGRIWYVAPTDKYRYEVTFANALPLFETHAVGITNSNLEKIRRADQYSTGNSFGKRFSGKLFLQVEDKGRIWYVDFNGLRHEVTWENLMSLFRKLSLGITNINLEQIPIGGQAYINLPNFFYKNVRTYTYRNGSESLKFSPFSSIGYGYLYDLDRNTIDRKYAAQTNCGSATCFDDAIKLCTSGKSLAVQQGSLYETLGSSNSLTCNVRVIDNPSNGSRFLNSYECNLPKNQKFDFAIHNEMNITDYQNCTANSVQAQRFAYARHYTFENGIANLEIKNSRDEYEFTYDPATKKSLRSYNAETNCGSATCFDDAFKTCDAGKTLAIGDLDTMYAIDGVDSATGLCKVRVTQRAVDDFLETITCTLDNSKLIDTAIDEEFYVHNYKNCTAKFSK